MVAGGGGGDPDPEIRGDPVSKIFVLPFGVSVWSKNKRGWGGGGRAGPQGPSPGSATALCEDIFIFTGTFYFTEI